MCDVRSPAPPTRADLILEAILTVGEIRKPGYALKVMRELVNREEPVTILRPNATEEAQAEAREDAVMWLKEATIRARARAEVRKRPKGERRR